MFLQWTAAWATVFFKILDLNSAKSSSVKPLYIQWTESERFAFRWFKEEKDQLVPLRYNDRIYILAAGLLRINKVRLDDRGKYICWVNNTAGEDTVQMILSVSCE